MKHNLKIRIKGPESSGGIAALRRRLFQKKRDVTFVVSGGAVKSISVFNMAEDGEPDED